MIERCLIVDVETTGLEEDDNKLEVGAILYSITNKTILAQGSLLMGWNMKPVTEEITGLTGITQAAVDEFGQLEATAPYLCGLDFLNSLAGCADVYVAHNAEFDKGHLLRWHDKPWLCTLEDFVWKKGRKGANLSLLLLDHGLGVVETHRALTDCNSIARLFSVQEDLPAMFAQAMRPKALFAAVETWRTECKKFFHMSMSEQDEWKKPRIAAGFKWNRDVPQRWSRRMAIEDATVEYLGFPVERVEE